MRGREREREIDWDEEMRGRIKRGGGEIREWLNVEKNTSLYYNSQSLYMYRTSTGLLNMIESLYSVFFIQPDIIFSVLAIICNQLPKI